MIARRLFGISFGVAALFAVSGCDMLKNASDAGTNAPAGEGGVPNHAAPTLDDLAMPESAEPGTDGYYTLIGTISFHDSLGIGVHLIRVKVPVIGKTYDIPAGDLASVIGDPLEIRLSADVPLGGAGATTYQVSLVDTDGVESQPATESVVLQ